MRVVIAADPVGVPLKDALIVHIEEHYGLSCIDYGMQLTNEAVDHYPYSDYATKVCEQLVRNEIAGFGFGGQPDTLGILICSTGINMSIAANRHQQLRCAVVVTESMARHARQHNDANVIALGARIIDKDTAMAIVDTFLDTVPELSES